MGAADSASEVQDSMLPKQFKITNRYTETKDTFTIRLEPAEAGVAPFLPGQFNMIYAFGQGEVPISHSGDPSHAGSYTHTIRGVGSVTRALARLRPGDTVGVRGPFGSAWPVNSARSRDLILVAGGIGLAPLRPILYAAVNKTLPFSRVVLLYGARTPQDALYTDLLLSLSSTVEVHITVDHAAPTWSGQVGVATALIDRLDFNPEDATAMVCGPDIMMRFAADALVQRGVAHDSIFLSLERNMKCAIGHCGHCQYGPFFICKDGPVFPLTRVEPILRVKEL